MLYITPNVVPTRSQIKLHSASVTSLTGAIDFAFTWLIRAVKKAVTYFHT